MLLCKHLHLKFYILFARKSTTFSTTFVTVYYNLQQFYHIVCYISDYSTLLYDAQLLLSPLLFIHSYTFMLLSIFFSMFHMLMNFIKHLPSANPLLTIKDKHFNHKDANLPKNFFCLIIHLNILLHNWMQFLCKLSAFYIL